MQRIQIVFALVFSLHPVTSYISAQYFTTPVVLTQNIINGSQGKITTADIDGDGLIDILASSAGVNIYWFKNLGNDLFSSEKIIYDAEIFCEAAEAIDVDGDGDLDVIGAFSFSNEIDWIENIGGGQFGDSTLIASDLEPMDDMILVDLNHDGKRDIVFSTHDIIDRTGHVYWIRNNGGGQFSSKQTISYHSEEVKKLECADLNGDGWQDVIAASYWDFKLVWFENLKNGTFSDENFIRDVKDSVRNFCVFPADIDGDGDLDIVNGVQRNPLIRWYENNGDGIFISEHIISDVDGAWDVAVVDFDFDGDNDLFTGFPGTEEVAYFENTGSGLFNEPVIVAEQISVLNDINFADLDQDRDIDVVASSTLDNRYLFFENDRFDCIPNLHLIDTSICENEPITVGNLNISGSGEYFLATVNGPVCDTLYIISVIVHDTSFAEHFDTISLGTQYTLPDGNIVSTSGTYTNPFLTSAGCDSTIVTHLFVEDISAVHNPDNELNFSFYPNPATSYIRLNLHQEYEDITLEIFNVLGIQIFKTDITNKLTVVHLPELQEGVYFLQLSDRHHQLRGVRKLCIQNL
ncbi:MAG TPA: T9SS type A sorting domain-containing protein [Saprospiraceae bacterium]|nr:T9SS type A sorting domain-containing protein [Saprospiraceae bacterium]